MAPYVEPPPDHRNPGQIFRDQEEAYSSAIARIERKNRIIDYTPIDERSSPCLNRCGWFNVDRASCFVGEGRIIQCVEKCDKYRTWMISRFADGADGLARYINEIRAMEAKTT